MPQRIYIRGEEPRNDKIYYFDRSSWIFLLAAYFDQNNSLPLLYIEFNRA